MNTRDYALQGAARIRVAARVVMCAPVPATQAFGFMAASHVTPGFWSTQETNGLGSTTKPGAPPG